ncbi:MAG: hypothetical protein M9932_07575 [Xanthobacteraceae bacterium]|nr:hypothetical protein [Xanthobacteraceae bacterium]
MIKASDILIARRADTKARADFPTWRMMAKLNAASSLSSDAQAYLADYEKRLGDMSEAEATEATIQAIYRSYYAEMGGAGTAPDASLAHSKAHSKAAHLKNAPPASPASADPRAARETPPDNVIALQQARRAPSRPAAAQPAQKPRLPVALIFICLIVITVGLRYLL